MRHRSFFFLIDTAEPEQPRMLAKNAFLLL
jgi:hypothetical protein